MSVVLRPIIEESALLKEKMAQQESSFRQDREKLLREAERHKLRANEEAKKAAEDSKSRDLSEAKASASERKVSKLKKELEKKEGELEKAQKELSAAEDEMVRLAKKREEEDAAAILEIETAFVTRVVKPKLAGMKEESYRLGYGEGFSACKRDVLAERPDLAELLEGLKYIYEEGYSAPEVSEQLNEASDEHTVDDAAKESEEEAANDTAPAETTQGQEVPAEKAQGQKSPVIEGDVAGSDLAAA